jgi:hypothetical protein
LHQVHRLVAKEFIPNDDPKKEINHKDGNPKNNHVSNLEWVTHSENLIHAHANGLVKMPTGKNHHMFGKTGNLHPNFGKKWKLKRKEQTS